MTDDEKGYGDDSIEIENNTYVNLIKKPSEKQSYSTSIKEEIIIENDEPLIENLDLQNFVKNNEIVSTNLNNFENKINQDDDHYENNYGVYTEQNTIYENNYHNEF